MHRSPRTPAHFERRGVAVFTALILAACSVTAQGRAQADVALTEVVAIQPVAAVDSKPARPDSSVEAAFTRADVNGDGRLSLEETRRLPAVNDRFDEIDANHDHFLSREEFRHGVAN